MHLCLHYVEQKDLTRLSKWSAHKILEYTLWNIHIQICAFMAKVIHYVCKQNKKKNAVVLFLTVHIHTLAIILDSHVLFTHTDPLTDRPRGFEW